MPRKRKSSDREPKTPKPAPATRGEKGDAPPGPPKEEPRYTELVLVAHASNLPEAELLKTELHAHGIPAVLEGEGAGVAGIPDVGAGVPILVPEEFTDQAAELIAELEAAKPEEKALDEHEALLDDDEEEDIEELEDEDIEEEEEEEEEELEEDLEEEEEEEDWGEEEEEDWEDEDEDY